MVYQDAIAHEKSEKHEQKLHDLDTWNPQPDEDAWVDQIDCYVLFPNKDAERMQRVDNLRHLIPFWQQQVEAANQGVDLRLGDFLDNLEGHEYDWVVPLPQWGNAPTPYLDIPPERQSSNRGTSQTRSKDGQKWSWNVGSSDHDESFEFVEQIAKMSSVKGERRARLHTFYRVSVTLAFVMLYGLNSDSFSQLSTDEKLVHIKSLIDVLRTTRD